MNGDSPNAMWIPEVDEKPAFDWLLLFQHLLIFGLILFLFTLLYEQAPDLNQNHSTIFKPGGVLLTLLLAGALHFSEKIITLLLEKHSILRKILKYGMVLLVIGIVSYAYFFPEPLRQLTQHPQIVELAQRIEPVQYIAYYQAIYQQDQLPQVQTLSSKYEITTPQLSQLLHAAINRERSQIGLTPLQWNSALEIAAQKHSFDMQRRNYFDHVSPDGKTFISRYEREGFNCNITSNNQQLLGAENLFLNSNYKTKLPSGEISEYKSPEEVVQSTIQEWMNSPFHRENILNPNFKNEGIGIAISSEGKVYITENFC